MSILFSFPEVRHRIAPKFVRNSFRFHAGLPDDIITYLSMDGIAMAEIPVKLTEDPRETLNKTKSTRSNEQTHGSDFVTLRFIQRIPCSSSSSALSTYAPVT